MRQFSRQLLRIAVLCIGLVVLWAIAAYYWWLVALATAALLLLVGLNPRGWGEGLAGRSPLRRIPGLGAGGRRRFGAVAAAYLLPVLLLGGLTGYGLGHPSPDAAARAASVATPQAAAGTTTAPARALATVPPATVTPVAPTATPAAAASTVPAATVTAVVAAQQSAVLAASITGFGATDAVWNQTHSADPQAKAGAAYNPGPNGQDEYAAVHHAEGRVLGYLLYLPHVMTATAAKDFISHELPFDAQLEDDKVKDACEMLLYKSALLGNTFATDPKIGDADGWIGVVFSSPDFDHYDQQRVRTVDFSFGWPDYTSGKC